MHRTYPDASAKPAAPSRRDSDQSTIALIPASQSLFHPLLPGPRRRQDKHLRVVPVTPSSPQNIPASLQTLPTAPAQSAMRHVHILSSVAAHLHPEVDGSVSARISCSPRSPVLTGPMPTQALLRMQRTPEIHAPPSAPPCAPVSKMSPAVSSLILSLKQSAQTQNGGQSYGPGRRQLSGFYSYCFKFRESFGTAR
jgi:hypothetical protein